MTQQRAGKGKRQVQRRCYTPQLGNLSRAVVASMVVSRVCRQHVVDRPASLIEAALHEFVLFVCVWPSAQITEPFCLYHATSKIWPVNQPGLTFGESVISALDIQKSMRFRAGIDLG